MKKDNVIQLTQWKARASLISKANIIGWDVTKEDLAGVDRPCCFYICEPLQSGHASAGVFERARLEKLVATGTKDFGSKSKIFNVVSACTMDMIINESEDDDQLDSVIIGNLINFAGTHTAELAIKNEEYNHFGVIIYDNPLRSDGTTISFRPIALSESTGVLDHKEILDAVSSYLFNDYDNHPEYFNGHNIIDIIKRFSEKLGVDLDTTT
jgi:hypothetical protein